MNNDEVLDRYITTGFNMHDPNIALKHKHSFSVAQVAELIGKHLNLDTKLSHDIGLLHDFGRFDQWSQFKTYNDSASVDHGDLAVKLLFEDNIIEQFDVKKEDYDVIMFAIKYHNKKEIDFEEIDACYKESKAPKYSKEQTIMYCKLARDADKKDIFHLMMERMLAIGVKGSGVSKACLDSLNNHTYVTLTDVKTKLDKILSYIGMLYDINFDYTFTLFDVSAYLKTLQVVYGSDLSSEDKQTLDGVVEEFVRYKNIK